MAGYGLSAADIAQVLNIELNDLEAAYASQLTGGKIKANAKVAESLYRKAIGEGRESVTAAIFWLKTRARWKEASVHEHVGQMTHDDFILSFIVEQATSFTVKTRRWLRASIGTPLMDHLTNESAMSEYE